MKRGEQGDWRVEFKRVVESRGGVSLSGEWSLRESDLVGEGITLRVERFPVQIPGT